MSSERCAIKMEISGNGSVGRYIFIPLKLQEPRESVNSKLDTRLCTHVAETLLDQGVLQVQLLDDSREFHSDTRRYVSRRTRRVRINRNP